MNALDWMDVRALRRKEGLKQDRGTQGTGERQDQSILYKERVRNRNQKLARAKAKKKKQNQLLQKLNPQNQQ